MEFDLLMRELLDKNKELSSDVKDLQKQVSNNKTDGEKLFLIVKNLEKDFDEMGKRVSALSQTVNAIEKDKTEIKGFAKYAKLIWPAIIFVAGYLIKTIGGVK